MNAAQKTTLIALTTAALLANPSIAFATQGKSHSNPDGGGVDKPYPADGKDAKSQGNSDYDGNNGCGNDEDREDDNNGNCGKKKQVYVIQTPKPSLTPSSTKTPVIASQGAPAITPVAASTSTSEVKSVAVKSLANTGSDFENALLALAVVSPLLGLFLMYKYLNSDSVLK